MTDKNNTQNDKLTVAISQLAPVWLNRNQTLNKILTHLPKAKKQNAKLIVFGEALLPGYPFWLDPTGGANFNSPIHKEIHAHYLDQAVQIESGHLKPICDAAATHNIAVYLGCIERPADRGGHSLYCSLVYIDAGGTIQSVHRKLVPTYDERLTWSPGDGHGLQVHKLGPFTVGGLNCWENWMPLARTALYALGEDLHIAVWPGSRRNTFDITRHIAKESRSYVISASALMRKSDFPSDTPHLDKILANCADVMADGGSCIAGPDGEWVVEPVVGEEKLIVATIDHKQVRAERQNFDPVGHYSRPDVLKLMVDNRRQSSIGFFEHPESEQ
jgi:nitrilase